MFQQEHSTMPVLWAGVEVPGVPIVENLFMADFTGKFLGSSRSSEKDEAEEEVTIRTGGSRDELVPIFQLAVLLAIARSPDSKATARQITEDATARFKKRLDTAQAHIALSRLNKRGLTTLVPDTDPREYKCTERGMSVTAETVATMLRVIGEAPANTSREMTPDGRRRSKTAKAVRR